MLTVYRGTRTTRICCVSVAVDYSISKPQTSLCINKNYRFAKIRQLYWSLHRLIFFLFVYYVMVVMITMIGVIQL